MQVQQKILQVIHQRASSFSRTKSPTAALAVTSLARTLVVITGPLATSRTLVVTTGALLITTIALVAVSMVRSRASLIGAFVVASPAVAG